MAAPLEAAATPPTAPSTSPPAPTTTLKPIHSLVLDTGPLIKNDPPADVLRARAEQLYTIPSVIAEIRDPATRARVETTLLPFVTIRAPKPESVKIIQDFARRTGDLEVLSRPDLAVLALGYELECERNGGDWRLRNTPGQTKINDKPPHKQGAPTTEAASEEKSVDTTPESTEVTPEEPATTQEDTSLDKGIENLNLDSQTADATADHEAAHEPAQPTTDQASQNLTSGEKADESIQAVKEAEPTDEDEYAPPSDNEGEWITPSNVEKQKAKDSSGTSSKKAANQPTVTLQAAILTSDYAMQNVALRMNLNLVTPQLSRISSLKTYVLRCHGCFKITRVMEKRFCPSCGQPNLIRTTCRVDDKTGALTIFLKDKMEWRKRGNVYSIPKPVHGSSNGGLRVPKGISASNGGTGGWGRELILAEDQKEFIQANVDQERAARKAQDVMDQDYLPSILGGGRPQTGGKIRVGAGRNVNSKKRRK